MTAWLVQSLVGSALLLGAVIVLRPLAFPRLGARLTYCLWLLPLARLALPALPIWTLPEGAVLNGMGQGLPVSATVTGASNEVAANAMPTDQIVGALLLVWAVGAVVHLGWRLAAYLRFIRRAEAASTGPQTVREGVAIRTSAFVSGPVAAGIWRRQIFLPLDFDLRFDAEECRLILAHELAHHRRRDIAWNFAAVIVVSLHWFNPLAHYAYSLYRLDQELACDAEVVAVSPASRFPYGKLLTRAVWHGANSPLCSLSGKALLKRRLAALAAATTPSSRAAQVALTPLAIAGLLLTAPRTVGAVEGAEPSLAISPATTQQHVPEFRSEGRPQELTAASGSPGHSRLQSPDAPAPSPQERRAEVTPPLAEAPRDGSATTGSAVSLPYVELAARRDAGSSGNRYPLADPALPHPPEGPVPASQAPRPVALPAPAEAPQYGQRAALLAARREAGLLRSQYRLADPARSARDRGRPVSSPPPTGT
jgi:bla regulator protein BlaR1